MDLIVAQLHVHYTEQPKWPLIGTVHIVVVFIIWFCISGQSLESLGTIPLTYDSLLILRFILKDVRAQKFPRTDFFKTCHAER